MDSRKKLEIKHWFKRLTKKDWLIFGGFIIVLAVIITCILVAMHLCGYSLADWLAKYYPWVVMTTVIVVMIGFFIIVYKATHRGK